MIGDHKMLGVEELTDYPLFGYSAILVGELVVHPFSSFAASMRRPGVLIAAPWTPG